MVSVPIEKTCMLEKHIGNHISINLKTQTQEKKVNARFSNFLSPEND